ncbi:hypothetical protein GCM10009589_29040 [Arthrobacter pascens]|nr:NERD domain-containing protein [Arthrobacter pascens]
MGAADRAFEQSRLSPERIARLKRDLDTAECAAAGSHRRVAGELGRLGPDGWFLLHDVHWPGRPLARLDHVLVGPGGVVVVSTKTWNGHVDVRDGVLRQNGYARNPVIEVALGQAAAVAALLPANRRRFVRSMVCMASQPDLSGTTLAGVEVHGTERLVAAVAGLPGVLDPDSVVRLYALLGRMLTEPQAPEVPVVPLPAPPVSGAAGRPARKPAAPGTSGHRSGRYPTPYRSRSRRNATQAGVAWVAGTVSAALLAPALWVAWEYLSG